MITFRQFLSEKTDFESATNDVKFEAVDSVKDPIWNPTEDELKKFDHELESLKLGSSMKEKNRERTALDGTCCL